MRSDRKLMAVLASFVGLSSLAFAASAHAAGYTLTNAFESGGTVPVGIAVDQNSGEVYVANLATTGRELFSFTGVIAKFDAQGNPGAPATMKPGGGSLVIGTAVDPTDNHPDAFYIDTSFGANITRFDPATGSVDAGFPFAGGEPAFAQIATDAAGDVYAPAGGGVNEYSSAGALLNAFSCSACPGGAFGGVTDVAVDSTHSTLYVADHGNNRVMKMATSDPPGQNATVFYQGASSTVAFDSADEHLFVGGDDGSGFHITEHEASGAKIADFGLGEFTNGFGADQIAVNDTTGQVYATDTNGGSTNIVLVYRLVPTPIATTGSASEVSQTNAILNATVNPEGGETAYCHFEYGPTILYGKAAVCSPDPGEASTDTAVVAKAFGLSPDTTYHFRVVESTFGGGITYGADQTFTTPPVPAPVTNGGSTSPGQTTTPSPSPPAPQPSPVPPTCKTDASLCPKPKPRSKPIKCKKGFAKKKVHGKSRCVKVKRKQVHHKRNKATGNKKKHH